MIKSKFSLLFGGFIFGFGMLIPQLMLLRQAQYQPRPAPTKLETMQVVPGKLRLIPRPAKKPMPVRISAPVDTGSVSGLELSRIMEQSFNVKKT